MEENKKTIVVSFETWKKLSRIKLNLNAPDIDTVISNLLKKN